MALAVTAPSMNGVSTTPEEVADVPITPWTKSGTKAIVPTIAIADRPTEATPAATIGLRRNSNGRIGSFALRSTNTNAVSETSAIANAPSTCVEPHGCVSPPQTSPSRNELVPIASSVAPSRSSECSRRSVRFGIAIAITTRAAAPTGRLT